MKQSDNTIQIDTEKPVKKGFLNSVWIERIFTVALAIAGILLTQGLISRRDYNARLRKDFEARPTTEMVNNQVGALKVYVDKQDTNTANLLEQHINESRQADENLKDLVKSIDGKVNILLNRTGK